MAFGTRIAWLWFFIVGNGKNTDSKGVSFGTSLALGWLHSFPDAVVRVTRGNEAELWAKEATRRLDGLQRG